MMGMTNDIVVVRVAATAAMNKLLDLAGSDSVTITREDLARWSDSKTTLVMEATKAEDGFTVEALIITRIPDEQVIQHIMGRNAPNLPEN